MKLHLFTKKKIGSMRGRLIVIVFGKVEKMIQSNFNKNSNPNSHLDFFSK
jgi:hypothetical protein